MGVPATKDPPKPVMDEWRKLLRLYDVGRMDDLTPVQADELISDLPRRLFIGNWQIVDHKGHVRFHIRLFDNFQAKKSHAPDVAGKWNIVGNEVRIEWSDGWGDILRPQKSSIQKLGFGPGTTWGDAPADEDIAIMQPI
jgi:hypothetical protein